MVKVTNKTDRVVELVRWKVRPNSSDLLDAGGYPQTLMPDDLAFSTAAKRLADQGLLHIEGYSRVRVPKAAKVELKVETKVEAPNSDVTVEKRKKGK